MLIMRLLVLLAVLGIGGSLLLWLLTGNPRYRLWAWKAFRIALVVLFVFFALFVLERVLVPLG
jgi:heme O synthase-like polyprenyltransferase